MEKLPAYKKCYNKLKSDIDNNVYPIGSYLPTEDELGKNVFGKPYDGPACH